MSPAPLPSDIAARLLLYSLPNCGPARAAWLSHHPKGIVGAVAAMRGGDLKAIEADRPRGVTDQLISRWCTAALGIDEISLLEAHQATGEIVSPGHPFWYFEEDPDPPLFLHAVGDTELLTNRPAVGIVGTRRCTTVGRRVARQLGADLASAGITVVSGLAKGVDGAAHEGTLAAGGSAIAVVASGLDVIYPLSNTKLWHQVETEGLLLSEAPLGTTPERWRFPARNRIIAALSDFVVVVESHARGGALSTAEEATLRGISVGAVPGSVTSPAAAGTNALLMDGCTPIRHAGDVLDALGLFLSGDNRPPLTVDPTDRVGHMDQMILDELQAGAVHFDTLMAATQMPIQQLMALLAAMSAKGMVRIDGTTVVLSESSVNPPTPAVRL